MLAYSQGLLQEIGPSVDFDDLVERRRIGAGVSRARAPIVRPVTSTRTPSAFLGRNRGDAFMASPSLCSAGAAAVFVVSSTVLRIVGGPDRRDPAG